MSDDKTKPTGAKNLREFFATDMKVEDFAASLSKVPQVAALMRIAGLQDSQAFAGVKMTSSRMDALRAKAVGTKRAKARAERAGKQSARMARVMKAEADAAQPELSVLGPLASMANQFQLFGKVVDKNGAPVPGAKVEVSGANTGVLFSAVTDEKGIYSLKVPVGLSAFEADDGEVLNQEISLEGTVVESGLMAVVKAGEMARKVLTVPLAQQLQDLAAPILGLKEREEDTVAEQPAKSSKGSAERAPKKTPTPAKSATKTPQSAKRAAKPKAAAQQAKATAPQPKTATATKPKATRSRAKSAGGAKAKPAEKKK